MLFHIVCGLLLLNIFASEAATPRSKSTGLLGLKKLLAAAKKKMSKITFSGGSSVMECYDQAPEGCMRLYEEGVCNHKEVAKEYCRVTCGFCVPKNRGSRPEEYIASDEWYKIPNLQPPDPRKNLGFDSMF